MQIDKVHESCSTRNSIISTVKIPFPCASCQLTAAIARHDGQLSVFPMERENCALKRDGRNRVMRQNRRNCCPFGKESTIPYECPHARTVCVLERCYTRTHTYRCMRRATADRPRTNTTSPCALKCVQLMLANRICSTDCRHLGRVGCVRAYALPNTSTFDFIAVLR